MSKYELPVTIVEIENHVGHWKIGTGAASLVDEVRESRKIASRVHAILKEASIPSTYFQDEKSTNKNDNLKTLVAHHNADVNGLVVSWHLNSTGGITQNGIGTEVLYTNDKWKPLAEALSAAIAQAGNFKNRGAKKRDDLYVLNNTKEPSIIVETFFVNSTADVAMYNRHFDAICQASATVLASAIGKTLKPSKPSFNNEILKARDHIRKAVISGVFTSKHENVNNYSTDELLKYLNIYIDRLTI
ncbi:MAG: N-acetylmuramoyl-L-alanine amidase [Lysinibacillus sp.]